MLIKYQAALFADLTAMAATPQKTLEVMTAFANQGVELLPTAFQELAPPTMTPAPRLRFSSPAGGTEVLVGSGRLDVIKQKGTGGEEIGAIGTFADFVERCISAVFGTQVVRASRLAFIVQSMSDELSAEALNASFSRLFNSPDFYHDNSPTEWTFRANSQHNLAFGDFAEPTNTILKTERVQGRMADLAGEWQEFDRIVTEIDINTLATNTDTRFVKENLRTFVEAAAAVAEVLKTDMTRRLA